MDITYKETKTIYGKIYVFLLLNSLIIILWINHEHLSKIETRHSTDFPLKVLVIGLGQLGLPVQNTSRTEEDLIRMVMTLVQKQWIVHRK